jgi:hypothetical protein
MKSSKRLKRKPFTSSDICLIVHGSMLLHTKHHNLIAQPDESLFKLTPTELANAARRLLPVTTKRTRIALALPGSEFVATTLKLPPVAAQNIKNVVNLQLPTLLPGVTEPLLLAVQAPIKGEKTCALWMPSKRAEELFQAFDKEGLFLNCILPRPVVVLPNTSKPYQVYDEDDNTITCLEWSNGVIQRWLHLPKAERDEPEFQTQLEEALSSLQTGVEQEWKSSVSDWENLPSPLPTAYDYAFIPPGAAVRKVKAVQRKKRMGLIFALLLLITGIIGGIYYAIDYELTLKQRLTELKRRTVNISQLRAEVGEIEQLIGPIKNLPRQDIVTILESLDNAIPKDSWIVSFHIEEGFVKLEGYSPEPTELIEKLTNEPRFVEVGQTRDISKEGSRKELRFGIGFRLKDFDLESYRLEYFSER